MVQWAALERDVRREYIKTRSDIISDHDDLTYETLELLERMTTKDGTINRQKLSSLFDRLDALSSQHGKRIYDKTEDGMSTSARITAAFLLLNVGRSEERRVGKECRSRL